MGSILTCLHAIRLNPVSEVKFLNLWAQEGITCYFQALLWLAWSQKIMGLSVDKGAQEFLQTLLSLIRTTQPFQKIVDSKDSVIFE